MGNIIAFNPCSICKKEMCSICELKMLRSGSISSVKWISVDERLPNDSMTVITCNAKGEVDADYYGYYGLGFSDKTVTHWMPLPEAPKGE